MAYWLRVPLPLLLILALTWASCEKAPSQNSLAASMTEASEGSYERIRAQGDRIAAALDDRLLVSQLIMAGFDGNGTLTPDMKSLLEKVPPGALMAFRYNLGGEKDEVRAFLALCGTLVNEASGLRPFIAVDHEGGQVHRFGPGISRLPPPAFFREMAETGKRDEALKAVRQTARAAAAEIRDLGITLNLAPVAETLNGGNHFFLEDRSYGPDPDFTAAAAAAFIRGMEEGGVACAVKHFPGNSGDPHREIAVLDAEKTTLDEMVRPFAFLIRTLQPSAVMVSHIVVPPRDRERNASLSRAVIEDWLRGELRFQGFVLGDDFSMKAVSSRGLSPEAAAVEALKAGVDMIMAWPPDLSRLHQAILGALAEGRLSRERLQEAAGRIIAEKIRWGLIPREEEQ